MNFVDVTCAINGCGKTFGLYKSLGIQPGSARIPGMIPGLAGMGFHPRQVVMDVTDDMEVREEVSLEKPGSVRSTAR